ncbi:MAG: GHMP kinase, partial [Clostridia bacterium]|nr:GHMP kinase [Clostridia bacterium]
MQREKTFCPYRVCPLGAHIDHQLGVVSGFAIDKGIEVEFEKTTDGSVALTSAEFSQKVEFSIRECPELQKDWADYLRGAMVSLARKHPLLFGIKAHVKGSLPIGGLSSSAAVIIAFLSALCRANDIKISRAELVEIALWAEREYVGVNVGKLDQSCEIYSKRDHLLYFDIKDDSYELIAKNENMKPFEIAIIFSGVERNLVGSKYNMRVDELKSAAYTLKAFSGMEYGKFSDTYLRDVPHEVFDSYKDKLPEPFRKRAEHYYTEFNRVQKGAQAWRNGDLETFGKLTFESGYSSIYNYETGSDELKKLYEIMLETKGIYGGRFSGAGFKGCCMALVNP